MSAPCPCCGEPETCLDDCTFQTDRPDQVAELSESRETAALRHELAELRAEAVELRRDNAGQLRDLAKLRHENSELCERDMDLRRKNAGLRQQCVSLADDVAALREDKTQMLAVLERARLALPSAEIMAPGTRGVAEDVRDAVDAARGKAGG